MVPAACGLWSHGTPRRGVLNLTPRSSLIGLAILNCLRYGKSSSSWASRWTFPSTEPIRYRGRPAELALLRPMVEGMELAVEQIDRPHCLRVKHFPRGVYRVVEEGCRFANTLLTAASGTRRQQAETSGAHKEGTTVLAASCSRGQPHTGGQG